MHEPAIRSVIRFYRIIISSEGIAASPIRRIRRTTIEIDLHSSPQVQARTLWRKLQNVIPHATANELRKLINAHSP